MSAESFVAYVGLRFEVPADEIERVEARSDPRIVAARRVGLRCYWGDFGSEGEAYLLFVGTQLGVFGAEHAAEAVISSRDFQEVMERTRADLRLAGFEGEPSLHLKWEPDF